MNPTTIAQSVLASQSDDSSDSVTKEIGINTSASNYATIVPITFDNYSDIEIDDIDDTDYVPPEELEGISEDIQDEEEAEKILIDSQEVEDL
ncbi:hypothetical protein G6F37_005134 [Rhizopus arrhizus]|nr:hypothetical protein G6F38_002797 [Rhizopus arrhizus]KAG1159180.1 hypothetical protein G6F37_005134 [Rhizopus arrhizus]